ncbi:MFS transporter [Amaricoccus sp.]|uniref:MFS transporter n=1 Tax=Amaricoccus sp. TaxID=1872485 RepID=UPI001B539353|nr:MFS transporter [Amaricoccus sp.]MBP7000173.1 MFS transporter [Amaricoccus sp.]
MTAAPGARDYARLFSAYVLALLGTGVAIVGLALLSFDIAGEEGSRILATALMLKGALYVLVPPVAAALTGRVAKKPLLIALDLVRAAALLSLPLATEPWQVYAAILVFTIAAAVFTPTYQALVPHLLTDPDDYARALAKSRVAIELENGASPAIAAGLLLFMSGRGLFVAVVAAFLVSAACIASARLPSLPPAPAGFALRRMTLGIRMLAQPALRGLVPLHLAAAAGVAMVTVNTVVLVQGDLGLDARASTAAFAVFGLGSVLGALAVPHLLPRIGERRTMLAGCALVSLALLAGAALGALAGLLAVWAAIGIGGALALTPAPMMLRRETPARRHASAYAAMFALANAALIVAYPVAGWVGAEHITHRPGFLALAALAGAATIATAALLPAAPAGRR